MTRRVFLDSPVFQLGAMSTSIEASHRLGRLKSDPGCFTDAGFRTHHVAGPEQSALDLAVGAVKQLEPGPVDAVIYATCLPQNGNAGDHDAFLATRDVKHLMDFPVSRLQARFGWDDAQLFGINQQACTGLLGSLRVATWMLRDEPSMHRALCVTADRFPPDALYEQSYNLISDGAAACTVSADTGVFEILGGFGLSNGALAHANDDETVGAFFPWAHRTIGEALARLDLNIDDIHHIVPQNTNRNAWRILSQTLGLDFERVAMPSLGDVGHMISGDNIVNLAALAPTVGAGERVLLFMAGYGLHWQVVILEKQ